MGLALTFEKVVTGPSKTFGRLVEPHQPGRHCLLRADTVSIRHTRLHMIQALYAPLIRTHF